jgi:hypothetical protein
MCRKLHNMSETKVALLPASAVEICLLVCLTLRGWRHIQNLYAFSTPTTVVQYFIMTLHIKSIFNYSLNQKVERTCVCFRHLTPVDGAIRCWIFSWARVMSVQTRNIGLK